MNFIVTTSTRGASRKQIWHSQQPLKIGTPLQWVMETTQDGVRITYLGGKAGQVSRDRVREISFTELKKNPQIVLDGQTDLAKAFQLRIEPAAKTAPAYAQVARPDSGVHQLSLYRTIGDWVLDSTPLFREDTNAAHTIRIGSSDVFKLSRSGEQVQVTPAVSQLFLIQEGKKSELALGSPTTLSSRDLASASLRYGNTGWKFGWVLQSPVVGKIQRLPSIDLGEDTQAPWFKKALRAAGVGLAALIALSFLLPDHKQEELIPPQLAKIILTTPKHKAAAGAESAPVATTAAQKKVQDTAVVQAFRAKALQNAVSGLMKGGMTKLLAQSDFVAGHRNLAVASQLLNTQSKDIHGSAPQIGDIGNKSIAVAALGGGAGGDGKAVGYGHGEHAAVSGQGKGFVSMDLANSSVEEGLTKDEVGEVIHRHLSEVRYCYESAMIRTPDIEGKLIVDFTIGGSGVVKTAEAKSSTLPDPRLDDCIIRRLLTWKFPLTKGGVDVAVTYPFIFKTLGR